MSKENIHLRYRLSNKNTKKSPEKVVHLTGPAIKTPVMQVRRPTEATAIWWSLPDCHISLTFSTVSSGSRSIRSFHILLVPLVPVSFRRAGLGGTTPPLEGRATSSDPDKATATKKAQARNARTLSKINQPGVVREYVLCTSGQKKNKDYQIWGQIRRLIQACQGRHESTVALQCTEYFRQARENRLFLISYVHLAVV